MRQFFDTSVLVAVVVAEHPEHATSIVTYAQSKKKDSACAAHSLAEVYATVTRLPGKSRMSCEQALLFIQEVRNFLTVVTLDEEDYISTLTKASTNNTAGGIIYDYLIARCALKAQADVLYTWNVGDFSRLAPEIARIVSTPS